MTTVNSLSRQPAWRSARRRALRAIAAAIACTSLPAWPAGGSALAFQDMYVPQGALGLEFSATIRALSGKSVQVLGYMAPPLKPEAEFFVLTRIPVALCPYCNSDADWPSDIVVVYARDKGAWAQDGLPVAVEGILELGSKVDQATGMVSLIRIVNATVRTLK